MKTSFARVTGRLAIGAMVAAGLVPARAGNAPSPDHDVTIEMPGAGPMTFRLIPAGRFMMGSPATEMASNDDERPVHEVVISQPFHLGIHEITCAQWKLAMGSLPDDAGDDPAAAVSGVLWQDCQEFIRKLSAQGFGTFRLPTEAEWEYACRAGTTTRFYWGDDPDHAQADAHCWHKGNSGGRTRPPGLKAPNPWGLHDMSGNAWEWCSDWFGPYRADRQFDPTGPATGKAHVLRGNGRRWGPKYARSANRFHKAAGHTTGLRLVLVHKNIPPVPPESPRLSPGVHVTICRRCDRICRGSEGEAPMGHPFVQRLQPPPSAWIRRVAASTRACSVARAARSCARAVRSASTTSK